MIKSVENGNSFHPSASSPEDYRFLLDHSADLITLLDRKGRFLFVSPASRTILGYAPDELIGQSSLQVLDPSGTENLREALKKALFIEKKPQMEITTRLIAKGGTGVWLEHLFKRLPADEKAPEEKILCISRNVTARMEAETRSKRLTALIGNDPRERLESGISLDNITEQVQSDHFLTIQFAVTKIIASNPTLEKGFKDFLRELCISLDWEVGEFWSLQSEKRKLVRTAEWHLESPEIQDFVRQAAGISFMKSKGLPGLSWKSGDLQWIEDIAQSDYFPDQESVQKAGLHGALAIPLFSEGKRLKGIMTFFTKAPLPKDQSILDILSVVRSQIEEFINRKDTESSLTKSEALFRTMSEYAPFGIFVNDADGNCIYTNSKYRDITALSKEEALGKTWKKIVHPEDRERKHGVFDWDDTLKTKRLHDAVHRIIRKGEIRWVCVNGALIMEGSEVMGFVGALEDITVKLQAEQSLKEYSDHLGELVEERTAELKEAQERILIQQRLEQEIQLAADIQRNLLPTSLPKFPGYDFGTVAIPARYVSGDLYDFISETGTDFSIALADISGKGISAALLTSTARTLLHSICGSDGSPDAHLLQINSMMSPELEKAEMFITMQLSRIEVETGKVEYCSAGHTETLWFKAENQEIENLESTGLPVGIDRKLTLGMKEFWLRPGDILVFYSDGVTEAENPENQPFGEERLKAVLLEHAEGSAKNIVDSILETVRNFAKTRPLFDDLTVFVVKALPRIERRQVPATGRMIADLSTWIRRVCLAYGTETAEHFELVASELITNIVRHAYGISLLTEPAADELDDREIRVEMELENDRIVMNLYDSGKAFDIERVLTPDLQQPKEGGYGIWIVRQLMDDVTYYPQEGTGNHWRIEKTFKGSTGE